MNDENIKCRIEYRKAVILLSLLISLMCQVKAQFVDITIYLQGSIELKSLSPLQASQKPDDTHTGNLSVQQKNVPRLNWTRIRTFENMVLMIEITYLDQMETKDARHAAYLNDGSDKISEARVFYGHRATFPVSCNTMLIERMNSPPPWQDAWIGIPMGIVREVKIEYN